MHRYLLIPLLSLICAVAQGSSGGVSPYGYTLFGPFTNALLTGIVFSGLLIFIIRKHAECPMMIPTRGQGIIEVIFESIIRTIEPIVGKSMVQPAFPLIASLFLFILVNNWSGLLPGVGAFGIEKEGHLEYWFRPANTDASNTAALALFATGMWVYFTVRYGGVKHFIEHTFGNKADPTSMAKGMFAFISAIFILVGVIEIISIGIRPLTLTMRLYGNIFGGENMLESIYRLAGFGFGIVAVPFYLLELLVGLVQAVVFSLLMSVYIGLSCKHEEHHH